jgi:hypothetical protein
VSNEIAEEYSKEIGNLYPESASSMGYAGGKAVKLTLDIELKEK